MAKHIKRHSAALFFVCGFIFDVLTLSRIDERWSLIQQIVYLLLISIILIYKTHAAYGGWTPPMRILTLWKYSDELLHFLLGSLLSAYTLFYFLSSSLSVSFLFMLVITALLVVNELPHFHRQEIKFKYALFALCVFSYLFIVVPIGIGSLGLLPFLTSLSVGLLIFYVLTYYLKKKNYLNFESFKTVMMPSSAVGASLLVLYVLKMLPPIPLSIQYIGIYHEVEKVIATSDNRLSQTEFHLKYDRPVWKFWQNGAQDFIAEPGDKIHCFARIFAPARFKDQIVFRWLRKSSAGWKTSDVIKNDITGGREEGFRALAVKSNYEEGDYRVQIETTDGREIGRISFSVEKSSQKNLVREFSVNKY